MSIDDTELKFSELDYDRKNRTGYPEVIFGKGKKIRFIVPIFQELVEKNDTVIATRVNKKKATAITNVVNGAIYYDIAKIVIFQRTVVKKIGNVTILSAGTSDIKTAEEAALVLETFGSNVTRIYDVGVAGIDRLLNKRHLLDQANVIICVAGMEGALPSVVAGMVSVPVIAVPTNIGYGASFKGVAALLAMLNSCANGVSVVNIGNGFGAAIQADMINKLATK